MFSNIARMQAYNLGRNLIPGGQLSTLLQSGIKTIPPAVQPKHGSTSSTIKGKDVFSVWFLKCVTRTLIF